jgi:hypothetical protein
MQSCYLKDEDLYVNDCGKGDGHGQKLGIYRDFQDSIYAVTRLHGMLKDDGSLGPSE